MLRVRLCAAAVLVAAVLSGCKSNSRSTAFAAKPDKDTQHHLLKGKVMAVDAANRQVTIQHGDIPGYMPGMTMPFVVENSSLLADVHPGDQVEADLVVANNTAYIQSIEATHPAGEHFTPAPKPGAQRYPQNGDPAQDFHLQTQDGKTVSLATYRGKPLLVDFIYSQCPQPQFCPLLNIKFAEMAKTVQADSGKYHDAQLLSVSIDPEHDTVPVLKSFSQHFDATKTGRWNFATGTPKQVHDFASNMGLDYWPESGQVVHSVVVYAIDKDGKIADTWRGNDWKPSEVLDAVKSLS
jgi:protein SCO1